MTTHIDLVDLESYEAVRARIISNSLPVNTEFEVGTAIALPIFGIPLFLLSH